MSIRYNVFNTEQFFPCSLKLIVRFIFLCTIHYSTHGTLRSLLYITVNTVLLVKNSTSRKKLSLLYNILFTVKCYSYSTIFLIWYNSVLLNTHRLVYYSPYEPLLSSFYITVCTLDHCPYCTILSVQKNTEFLVKNSPSGNKLSVENNFLGTLKYYSCCNYLYCC